MAVDKEYIVGFDLGNAFTKIAVGLVDDTALDYRVAPSYLYQILDAEIGQYMNDASENRSMFNVNGSWYLFGIDAQLRSDIRPEGAVRYTEEFYGVVFAIACFAAFEDSVAGLKVMATYPPRDAAFKGILKGILKQRWTVSSCGIKKTFTVSDVFPMDEPTAGVMRRIIKQSGTHKIYAETVLSGERIAVVDVGGHTTDLEVMNPGFQIQQASKKSIALGFNDMVDRARQAIRDQHPILFAPYPYYSEDKIRKMFSNFSTVILAELDGVDKKHWPDVAPIINGLRNEMVAKIRVAMQPIFSRGDIDRVLLTGGGSAALFNLLVQSIAHNNVTGVDEISRLQVANAVGALLALRMKLAKRG